MIEGPCFWCGTMLFYLAGKNGKHFFQNCVSRASDKNVDAFRRYTGGDRVNHECGHVSPFALIEKKSRSPLDRISKLHPINAKDFFMEKMDCVP